MQFIPRCLGVGDVAGLCGPVIILEDFAKKSFKVPDGVFHTPDQVEASLKAIAEFHAISQAMMRSGELVEADEPLLADLLKEGDILETAFCQATTKFIRLLKESINKIGIVNYIA